LSIAQLAHRVVRVLDAPSPVIVAKQAIPGAAVQKYVPDLQLAANELGLHARISLDDAIQRTARWESRELS
jgi:nucleoside-diphosphate-sugar epimerase